jgi:small nuclear ribonucleoprotein (snRNP)-like protein
MGRSIFISFILVVYLMSHALAQENYQLTVKRKGKPEKTHTFKVGQRIRLSLKGGRELQGKIIRIDNHSIQLSRSIVLLSEINSLSKKTPILVEAAGGIIGGTGMLMVFVGTSFFGKFAYDPVREEMILSGSALMVTGTLMLFRKSYSARRWDYHIHRYVEK